MLFALLIFAPTIAFVPHYTFLLLGIKVIPKKIEYKIGGNSLIIGAIVILSQLNVILKHLYSNEASSEYFSYSLLLILTYLVAKSLNKKHLIYIVYLILFEILIGWIEFGLGKHTILNFLYHFDFGQSEFGKGGLMYYSRVYGLSKNSSSFAYKVLGAILITYSLPLKKVKKNIIYIILLTGVFLSFNRTVIGSLLLFIFITQIPNLRISLSRLLIYLKLRPHLLILLLISSTIIIVLILNISAVFNQLNRGMTSIDTSSREVSYNYFISFIQNNFWLGNGSIKLWYDYEGRLFHAHNSFIQTLASNGVFIFLIYFLYVVKNINRYNAKYIIPILALSILQYGIFWGISFLDILFQYFLLKTTKSNDFKV